MNKQFKDILVGLIVLAVVLLLVWIFIDSAVTSINKLQSAIAGTILAATIAGIFAFIVNVYVKQKEAKDKMLQEIRVKKTVIYEQLVDIILSPMVATIQNKKGLTEDDLKDKFGEIMPKIIIWGSEDIIGKWNQIRRKDFKQAESYFDLFTPWNELLLLIRKDLGHSNKGLEPFALMKVYVKDFPNEEELKKKLQT